MRDNIIDFKSGKAGLDLLAAIKKNSFVKDEILDEAYTMGFSIGETNSEMAIVFLKALTDALVQGYHVIRCLDDVLAAYCAGVDELNTD